MKTTKKIVSLKVTGDYRSQPTNHNELEDYLIFEIKNNSATAVNTILKDGTQSRKRIFIGSNQNRLGEFTGKNKKHGRYFDFYNTGEIESIEYQKIESQRDTLLNDYTKFKKAFTQKCHKNLWAELQNDYQKLDVNDLVSYVENYLATNKAYLSIYDAIRQYDKDRGINIYVSSEYKTTSIKSHKPSGRFGNDISNYNACIANIKKHLDNKEEFRYFWQADYDIRVSGKVGEDGNYRAWFSAEYKNCGNGHYYLLINENTAIFAEDD